jgi:hypothetical protein
LETVRDAEENYMSNIPESLRGSIRYDNAEHSLAVFDEARGCKILCVNSKKDRRDTKWKTG